MQTPTILLASNNKDLTKLVKVEQWNPKVDEQLKIVGSYNEYYLPLEQYKITNCMLLIQVCLELNQRQTTIHNQS